MTGIDHSLHLGMKVDATPTCFECHTNCTPWDPCNCCRVIVEDPLEQELAKAHKQTSALEAELAGARSALEMALSEKNFHRRKAEKAEAELADVNEELDLVRGEHQREFQRAEKAESRWESCKQMLVGRNAQLDKAEAEVERQNTTIGLLRGHCIIEHHCEHALPPSNWPGGGRESGEGTGSGGNPVAERDKSSTDVLAAAAESAAHYRIEGSCQFCGGQLWQAGTGEQYCRNCNEVPPAARKERASK